MHKFLTAPTTKKFSPQGIFWFSLSMTFATTYGIMALQKAFRGEYVVGGDARVFVFWMQRFVDAELLPNDLIADYFQSVTPSGYAALFQLMASIGISPLFWSKVLPVVLILIATAYSFALSMEILPVPIAGFIATLLLNQNLWMKSMINNTPRGFIYALLPAFCYYLLRRSLLPCLTVILLQGLFYPPVLLIFAGILILQLLHWENGRLRFSQQRQDYLFCAAGLGVALAVMLPYGLSSSEFGPTITAAQARALPEFGKDGRSPFFDDDLWEFYLFGWQSGMIAYGPFEPRWIVWTGFLLPILLLYPSIFPLVRQVKSKVAILLQIVLVSVGLFFAAHAVLLKLYFPNRYTIHTLRIAITIAAGIAVTVLLDAILSWARQQTSIRFHWQKFLAVGATVLLLTGIVLYPVYLNARNYNFPRGVGSQGTEPQLYEYLSRQPKDILIASLSNEVDNLPTFAKRSILVGWEYANPYHLGYYRQISQRASDLMHAQYSEDLAEVKTFIQKYGVDFWLLERSALTPEYVSRNFWFRQWKPIANEVQEKLARRNVLVLSKMMERCSAFQTENLVLLAAECITKTPQK